MGISTIYTVLIIPLTDKHMGAHVEFDLLVSGNDAGGEGTREYTSIKVTSAASNICPCSVA